MDKAPPPWDDCQSCIGCEPGGEGGSGRAGGAADCELRGSQAPAPQAGNIYEERRRQRTPPLGFERDISLALRSRADRT